MSEANNQISCASFMVSVAESGGCLPLASSAPILPSGRINLDSSSCVEPGNSLFPNPQPVLPLSQAVQDEYPTPNTHTYSKQ
jgi:hypothetical protein